MKAIEITKTNFQEILKKHDIILLDFWATWCGPCKMFAPIFERVAEKHPEICFGKVNTDVEKELALEFDVQSIPTVVAFREGVMLINQAGMLPERNLESLIMHVKGLDINEVKKNAK